MKYCIFFCVFSWRSSMWEGISYCMLAEKQHKETLCQCSWGHKEPRSLRLKSRLRFHVWDNPCPSLCHLTDRCQRNQWQPIMLIPPVTMCYDPAVTQSCGKYVCQYHCRRQLHQHPPAHAHHLPHSNPSLIVLLPIFLCELLSWSLH